MPKVNEFKTKKAKSDDNATAEQAELWQEPGSSVKKRRPGRDEAGEAFAAEATHEVPSNAQEPVNEQDFEEPAQEKIKIEFKGSEFLRDRFKTPFDVVETVATDWLKGGDFSKLPIQHPLARYVAQAGLRKAKSLETQVLEHPMTEKILVQAFTLGLKAQGVVNEVKEKLKKKS